MSCRPHRLTGLHVSGVQALLCLAQALIDTNHVLELASPSRVRSAQPETYPCLAPHIANDTAVRAHEAIQNSAAGPPSMSRAE
ncbi:hypothetical protein PSPO01_10636 [Paraphaeosphaeria sporulosa]